MIPSRVRSAVKRLHRYLLQTNEQIQVFNARGQSVQLYELERNGFRYINDAVGHAQECGRRGRGDPVARVTDTAVRLPA